jgi:hypothetical protein
VTRDGNVFFFLGLRFWTLMTTSPDERLSQIFQKFPFPTRSLNKEEVLPRSYKKMIKTSGAILGGFIGVGTQIFANALRREPYGRSPWLHVLAGSIGMVLGYYWAVWSLRMQEDAKHLEKKLKIAYEYQILSELRWSKFHNDSANTLSNTKPNSIINRLS